MKALQLQIEGINSFKQRQTVNFEQLTQGGMFGIFGPTGSGKSTVLDALFLSLYGKMGRSGKNSRFINIEQNSAFVSLMFGAEYEGETAKYRIDRTFKVKNDGMKQNAAFYKIIGDEAVLQSENLSEVNELTEKIVGFSYSDFKRCISLTHGDFNTFLNEDRAQQVATIARIFNLERFGEPLCRKIADRRNLCEREIYALESRLSALGDISKETVAGISAEIAQKKEEHKRTKNDINDLTQTISAGGGIIANRKRLSAVNAALSEYEAGRADADKMRESLNLAKKSAAVMPKFKDMFEKEKQVVLFSDNLKKLNDNLKEKTEYEIGELKRYELIKEQVYAEVLKQTARREKLEMLKPDVKRLEELKGLREDILSQYGVLEKEMQKKTVERDSLKELLAKSEKYVDELSGEVANVSVSKEAVKAISLARDIEIEKRTYAAMLKQTEEAISEIEHKKIELSNAIKKFSFDTNELRSKLDRADERIMSVYGSNETRFETLAMLANENVARHKAVELAKHLNSEIRLLKKQNEVYAEKVEDYAKKSIKAIEIKTLAGRDKDGFEKALDEKQSERESYLGSNFLSIVTSKMDIGDTCPICEGKIEKLTKDSRISLESFDNEIKVIKHKINQSVQKHEEADGVRSELEARADELERLIELNANKINLLIKQRDAALSGYVEVRAENETALDEVLKLSDEKVAKLEQLVNASNQLEKDVIQKEKLLERKIAEYEMLAKEKERLDAEHERIAATVGELTMQYLKYEEVLKGTSARSVSDIIMDNDGKKARAIVKLAEQKEVRQSCALHIQELEGEINELRIHINALSSDSDAYENERVEINQRIATVVPDGSTVEDEQTACQNRINECYALEQKQRLKYENIERIIRLIDTNLAEQNAMYRLMQKDLNERKQTGIAELKGHGFSSMSEFKDAYRSAEDIRKMEEYVQKYDAEVAKLTAEQIELDRVTAGFDLKEEELKNLNATLDSAKGRNAALEKDLVILENSIDEIRAKAKMSAEIRESIEKQRSELKKADRLAALVGGGKLLAYVADDYIAAIADGASNTLLKLSNGRYSLAYEEDFAVVDNIAGGFKRDVNNLSGGESFLVTLSVSMAMSAAVSKISNRSVEVFFLDEGFGTLDHELLETVSDSIERLGGDISIGLISHVPALQNKVKNRIMLTPANDRSGSRINFVKE